MGFVGNPMLAPDVTDALKLTLQAALVLYFSHGLAVAILMYLDLSGKWDPYALSKNRPSDVSVRFQNYWVGWKSFCVDIVFLFIPFVMLCCYSRADAITDSRDRFQDSAIKLLSGYFLGKLWAFAIHYVLHFKPFYRFHRRHHRNPANLVASAAWDDSIEEYLIMEIPSFCLTLLAFPTHWFVHLAHFALHGIDGACGHSGFAAPGILGYIFDGTYHYYHHAFLTVNYAEVEFIDKLFGTHHSQKPQYAKKL